MKSITRLNCADLARQHGWTLSYADGFADGAAFRVREQRPPAYLLWGFDDYAMGFQGGFGDHDDAARKLALSLAHR